MSAIDRAAPWRAPIPLGIPGNVLQQVPALAGAYRNSGKMTAGLEKLSTATTRTVEASTRNMETVERLQTTLTNGLKQLETNLKDELEQAQRRVADEMERIQVHIRRNVLGDISRMVAQLGTLETSGYRDVDDAAGVLRQCVAQLRTDVQEGEANFMDSLAQLVVYNSWTTA
ncbi:hypothetical protein OC842_006432, partial [Tilletia horrida]